MLGILKPQSFERLNSMYTQHEPYVTSAPRRRISSSAPSMDRCISDVPPQKDPLFMATKRALRQDPLRLVLQDTGVLITMLPYLPWLFLPFKTSDGEAELYLNRHNTKEMLLQVLLFLYELSLLLLFLPALLILPGSVFLLLAGISFLFVRLIAWPMEGPGVAYSNMNQSTQASAERHKDERWIFINGCASSHTGLQADIDCVSRTFGRAVVGIHNKTFGLVADLVECLIQRVFGFNSEDVRVAYEQIKPVLLDPTVSKVILIGHSQGGIIISLVLDHLFDELPSSVMSKLEIYTFGSAASHFSNPRLAELDPIGAQHVIPYIEHYANEYDMVPRWGVLHSTRDILSNRYAGAVFVRMGASGHMFIQHYMDAMFRSTGQEPQRLIDEASTMDPFLDKVVNVDEGTVSRRETTMLQQAGLMRTATGLKFGDGEHMDDGASVNGVNGGDAVITFERTDSGRLIGEEAVGQTVRELSRLWRYLEGRSPDDMIRENGFTKVNGQ